MAEFFGALANVLAALAVVAAKLGARTPRAAMAATAIKILFIVSLRCSAPARLHTEVWKFHPGRGVAAMTFSVT
jgi:hypothetical protein